MIFGAIDYLCYKKRIGRFTNSNLKANHLNLAVATNFPTYPTLTNLPVGSIIFCHTVNSFMSWLIMYFDGSLLSHVCMVTAPGLVTDVTTSGVVQYSVSNYMDGESYLKIYAINNLSTAQQNSISSFSNQSVGSRYSWYKAIRIGVFTLIGRLEGNIFLYLDVLVVLSVFSLLIFGSNGPGLTRLGIVLGVYLGVVVTNRLIFKKK